MSLSAVLGNDGMKAPLRGVKTDAGGYRKPAAELDEDEELMPRTALFIVTLLLLPDVAGAKDLGNRLGLGVQTQLGAVPALSVRYGLPSTNPAINIQVEADFGIDTETGAILVGGRGLYAAVVEDNLNLYGYAGLGYVDNGYGGAFRIQPGFEIQAFPFGLENLGVTGSFGLNIDLGSQASLSTAGSAAAGLHYWF